MTPLFKINKLQIKKALEKLLLVILGTIATYLEANMPGLIREMCMNPYLLPIILGINTAIIDLIRKFITNEEGKLGGVRLVVK